MSVSIHYCYANIGVSSSRYTVVRKGASKQTQMERKEDEEKFKNKSSKSRNIEIFSSVRTYLVFSSTIASPWQRITVEWCFSHVISKSYAYLRNLCPLHLFAFTLCQYTNFSTCLKHKNFSAIFWDFFKFSVFPFRRFYAQIKNAHKNRLMETQLLFWVNS